MQVVYKINLEHPRTKKNIRLLAILCDVMCQLVQVYRLLSENAPT